MKHIGLITEEDIILTIGVQLDTFDEILDEILEELNILEVQTLVLVELERKK